MSENKPTRPARWYALIAEARPALEHLEHLLEELWLIQGEYNEWREGLPEDAKRSALRQQIAAVLDIGIEFELGVAEVLDAAEGVPLPDALGVVRSGADV